MLRFCDELIARGDRAGAMGPRLLRADSGFWANKTFDRLDAAAGSSRSACGLQAHVRTAIEQIDETAWATLNDYPATSIAQIAETTFGDRRLIVRRVRTLDKQGELLPRWELYRFATNRSDALATVEAEHRQHAVVELAIRDLKDQALAHFPSGKFCASAAWTVIAAIAHNLLRWTSLLGLPGQTIRAARTLRRRLLTMPRPPHQDRPALHASPPSPLALARRLHRSAHPHPRAPHRRLNAKHRPAAFAHRPRSRLPEHGPAARRRHRPRRQRPGSPCRHASTPTTGRTSPILSLPAPRQSTERWIEAERAVPVTASVGEGLPRFEASRRAAFRSTFDCGRLRCGGLGCGVALPMSSHGIRRDRPQAGPVRGGTLQVAPAGMATADLVGAAARRRGDLRPGRRYCRRHQSCPPGLLCRPCHGSCGNHDAVLLGLSSAALERWRTGADGEKKTACALRPLLREGWVLLNDLPRSFGNIDHVLIGPPGVFLLETKNLSGLVRS